MLTSSLQGLSLPRWRKNILETRLQNIPCFSFAEIKIFLVSFLYKSKSRMRNSPNISSTSGQLSNWDSSTRNCTIKFQFSYSKSKCLHIFRCASISCTDHWEWLTHRNWRSAISYVNGFLTNRLVFHPMWMICLVSLITPFSLVQNYVKCKIVQCAKLFNVPSYAKWKIMHSAEFCKVQRYAMCKIMRTVESCKVQQFLECKIIQSHIRLDFVHHFAMMHNLNIM